jgi:hypothetical protein
LTASWTHAGPISWFGINGDKYRTLIVVAVTGTGWWTAINLETLTVIAVRPTRDQALDAADDFMFQSANAEGSQPMNDSPEERQNKNEP